MYIPAYKPNHKTYLLNTRSAYTPNHKIFRFFSGGFIINFKIYSIDLLKWDVKFKLVTFKSFKYKINHSKNV